MTLLLGVVCARLVMLPPSPASSPKGVEKYRAFFAWCRASAGGTPFVVLRSFRQGGQKLVLALDPQTLTTHLLPEKGQHLQQLSWTGLRTATSETPYGRAITDSEERASAMQDAGLVHALPRGQGVVLTIDLCPSLHPLDRELLRAILANFEPEEKPVPLGIALTGVWMLEHPLDLAWLRQLEQDREITVTWINHSFHHRYAPALPLSRNFLLEPGTDLGAEVLKTEAAMIENGLQPSVFFRFPGLVSDPTLMGRVISYGLIPIGSDAWLAKGQVPSPGSIVLVHGNGNEPVGIAKFLDLVKMEKNAIREKHWLLFDLRESVSHEEERR